MILSKKKVSVVMITYGHEAFIEKAINSILAQECNFEIELIVSNDNSLDNTDTIVREILNQHPNSGWINYINHTTNVGMAMNLIGTLNSCHGEYIALCDGDDFWIDSKKLQKQIDFLESNEDYSLCFHQTKTVYDDGRENLYNNFTKDMSFDFIDLVKRPFISTVSSVFRNIKPLPAWFHEFGSDWPLFLFIATYGKLYYMNDCMAVYRRHSGGVWSSLSNDTQYSNTISLLDKLDKIFEYKYHEYFEQSKKARFHIHYPPVQKTVKPSFMFRVKNKLKSLFLKD